jgi:hypothetical protein
MLMVPFAWAMGILGVFCAWATWDLTRWVLQLRRADRVRAFIVKELDTMPRRNVPTRRDVLAAAGHYPQAWQPFIDRREARETSAPCRGVSTPLAAPPARLRAVGRLGTR